MRRSGRVLPILCLLLLFGTVAASAEETITLVYAGWGTPAQIASREAEVEAFYRAYPDTNIRIEMQFSPWELYHDRIAVQAASGTAPDVMVIAQNFIPGFHENGLFYNVAPLMERDGIDPNNFPPLLISGLTYDGHQVGLPTTGAIPGGAFMVYNRDHYDAAGLAYPTPEWTWDDFLSNAMRLTRDTTGDGDVDFWGTNIGKSTWEAVWEWHLRSYGGDVWNEDFTASLLNSPEAESTFTFLKDLEDVYAVSSQLVRPDQSFGDGRVGMAVGWEGWVESVLRTHDFAEAITMPRGTAGFGLPTAITGRAHAWTISANTKYPEEAWTFIKFLATSPEAVEARHFPDVPYIPNLDVWFAKLPERLHDFYFTSRMAYSLETEQMEVRRINRILPDAYSVVRNQIWQFYDGVISVTQALENAATQLTAEVNELNK